MSCPVSSYLGIYALYKVKTCVCCRNRITSPMTPAIWHRLQLSKMDFCKDTFYSVHPIRIIVKISKHFHYKWSSLTNLKYNHSLHWKRFWQLCRLGTKVCKLGKFVGEFFIRIRICPAVSKILTQINNTSVSSLGYESNNHCEKEFSCYNHKLYRSLFKLRPYTLVD